MNSLKKFKNTNGLKIGNIVLTIWTVTNILHSVLMVFIYSIMMAFPATIKNSLFWDLRLFSMGFYLVDIILNCVVERYEKGKESYWKISTFICITLAYNISYVGGLISQINEKDEEKKKRLKFFYKMCSENKISEELESKIANYIE
jgi:hypothetical protein